MASMDLKNKRATLVALNAEIEKLQKIATDLAHEVSYQSARECVAEWPEWMRNVLVYSASPTNPVPRVLVCSEDY